MTAPTDLRNALKSVYKTGPAKCPMAKVLDSLDEETRLVVEEKLFDPNFAATRLHKEIRRAGIVIGHVSVSDHRNGLCVCRKN